MRLYSKFFALFILILTACVPYHTEAEAPVSNEAKENIRPVAVGSYLLYLQAKQDRDFPAAIRY